MRKFDSTAILGFFVLSACAPAIHFYKPGATQQMLARDSYDCEIQARIMDRFDSLTGDSYRRGGRLGEALAGKPYEEQVFQKCMAARGYVIRKGDPISP